MSPKTIQLLSEKHIYVSWAIMLTLIGVAVMVGRVMVHVEAVPGLIDEVKKIQIERAGFVRETDLRLSGLEEKFKFLEKIYDIDFPKK